MTCGPCLPRWPAFSADCCIARKAGPVFRELSIVYSQFASVKSPEDQICLLIKYYLAMS